MTIEGLICIAVALNLLVWIPVGALTATSTIAHTTPVEIAENRMTNPRWWKDGRSVHAIDYGACQQNQLGQQCNPISTSAPRPDPYLQG